MLCGCGARAAEPPTAQRASGAPSPVATGGSSRPQLASRSATLAAARTEAGRQPVAVRIPGYPKIAAVRAYTTDRLTRGLQLPTDARTVAWWSTGAMPGDPTGTVVLAAHVSYNGQRGPFTQLNRLPTGAIVSVRQADGVVRNYRLAGKRQLVKSALDREDLFRTTGPPRLALITCGGAYDKATHSYRDNLILYALPTG